jgi:hypothetical protein
MASPVKRSQARSPRIHREEFKFLRDIFGASPLGQILKGVQSDRKTSSIDGLCHTSECRVSAGARPFGIACQKHRGNTRPVTDLNGGLDAARAPGEMKINDCQIGTHSTLNDPHRPSGIGGGTYHRMAELGQVHLQGEGNQMIILDDQDPHLASSIR